jgi:hypothetical protein
VLFFIEVGSRRVHFAGCTAHPDQEWVTQQARQMAWTVGECAEPVRRLIRDRAIANSPDALTTCFVAPIFISFARRFRRRKRTRSRNHSFGLSVPSVLTAAHSECKPPRARPDRLHRSLQPTSAAPKLGPHATERAHR